MVAFRTSFKTVIRLTRDLLRNVDDLEERLLSVVCPIPQDFYQTSNDLVRYCRERVEAAEWFRERHRDSAAFRFFDWVGTSIGFDRIAQHEQKLEDCGTAVELAIETIKAWSIAHERRRIFNSAEDDGLAGAANSWHRARAEITRRYENCIDRLEDVRERTRRRSYLQRMERARVDVPVLRQHARRILFQDDAVSRSTISPRPSYNPLRNGGNPRYSHLPDPSIRISSVEPLPDVHVLPQQHERGPSLYHPHAPVMAQRSSQLPHIVTVLPSESRSLSHHLHGPNPPARARSPVRYPRIVDLRDREREREVSSMINEHGPPLRRVDGHRVSTHTNSQDRNPDARRYVQRPSVSSIENEPTQDFLPRQRDSASQNRGRDLPTAPDHGRTTNERQSYPAQRAGHSQAATYVNIVPRQPSERGRHRSRNPRSDDWQSEYQDPVRESSSTSRRNSIHITEPSPHRRPQKNVNIYPQSPGSYNPQQTESRRRTSRTRPIRPEDRQSTKSSRSPSMSRGHQEQTKRSRRASSGSSNYDSGIDVSSNSGRNAASDRPVPQVPNVNRATRPPISMPQGPSRRVSSASSYDSGVFVSRSGSSDRSVRPETPTPRQPNVLHSYPPSSFYFDQDRPRRRRKSSRSRSSQGRQR